MILSLLTQAMDLHAIGQSALRDEAAADAEKLLQHMYAEENDAILIELDNHLHKRREIIFISNHSMSIKTIPKELRHSYDAPFMGSIAYKIYGIFGRRLRRKYHFSFASAWLWGADWVWGEKYVIYDEMMKCP